MGIRPRRVAVGVLSVALAAASTLAACSDSSEVALRGIVREQPLEVGTVTLPEVLGTDAESVGGASGEVAPFAFQAPPGELLVVYFGFTNCPDLCPTTLAELRSATSRLDPGDADKVNLAMVTVDPERDTADVLLRYVSSFSPRAHAVRTVDPAALTAAEEAFLASSQVVRADDGTVEVAHTASAYVVDDRGVVVVEWPFGLGIDGMEHDLRALLDPSRARS